MAGIRTVFFNILMLCLLNGCTNAPTKAANDPQAFLDTEYAADYNYSETYSIERKSTGTTVFFPQIMSDSFDVNPVNDTIRNHLSGPYPFLSQDGIAVDIDYEVVYHDDDLISVCYKGGYADHDSVGSICFGVTVNLKTGELLTLKDIFHDDEIQRIKSKINQQDFEVTYGAIGNGKGYVTIDEALGNHPDFWTEENKYQFCLMQNGLLLIMTGLPGYTGNYSIVQISM